MTLDELKEIFKYQTTKDDNYTPTGELTYWAFSGQDRINGKVAESDMEKLVTILEGYQHDGYRDRVPTFVKPEADL